MCTILEAKEHMKNVVREYLHRDAKGSYVMMERNRQPLYLEGTPGIGKTEIVGQVCEELKIGYVGASLVHMTRNSLLGLPVIRELEDGRKYTEYTIPEIIANVYRQVEKGYQEGILLLDEFPCMSETIMPTMFAFLQTKNIGVHKLPEGWVIVLCGNPPEYNRTARKFDCAVLDRIRKISITFDIAAFIQYGQEIGLEKSILDYLQINNGHGYRCREEHGEKELVTCRGWENLSHAIRIYTELGQKVDRQLVRQFIKSDEIAESFVAYLRQCEVGLSIEEMDEILSGRNFVNHCERFKKLTYHQQCQLSDYLCERITTKESSEELIGGKYKEMAKWMDNVLDMLMEVDEKGVLAERAYLLINKNEQLLKVVNSAKSKMYLALSEKLLGAISA